MKKYIDLSHTIEDGLITYKGLPAPIICDYLSRKDSKNIYGEGAEFQIGKIEMVSNTGTYLDCPFHRYADGKDLSEIALEALIDLDAVLIKIHHSKKLGITKEDLGLWFTPIRLLLIFPIYQVLLVWIGFLFGQFKFFWAFEKK